MILEGYIKKFEAAERTKSREIRLSLSDVQQLHLALTKILLENSETREQNINFKNTLVNLQRQVDDLNRKSNGGSTDGGSFR